MTWGLCEILEPVLVIQVCNPGSSFPQPNDYLQKRLHPLIMPSHWWISLSLSPALFAKPVPAQGALGGALGGAVPTRVPK